MLPYTTEVTSKKYAAYVRQHGSGFVFKNSASQKGNSLMWTSKLATLWTSPASFAFFAALLVQDISAFSRIAVLCSHGRFHGIHFSPSASAASVPTAPVSDLARKQQLLGPLSPTKSLPDF